MNIMDADVGQHVVVDELQWTVLDFFTDSALCILDGVLPNRIFGAKDWKNSSVRRVLNEEFSLKLTIGNIRNTQYDSKVFLLSKGMFSFYKELISEASENWWLMPENGQPLIVTNANLVVSVDKRAAAGVRPVVRYARNTECERIENSPKLIQAGQQLWVGDASLTFLERGRQGSTFLCIYNEPIAWEWDVAKGEVENFTSLEQFLLWNLKCIPVRNEWSEPALNGDKVGARVGRVSFLDLTRYRNQKQLIPPWNQEWMLSTKPNGKSCGFLSVNESGIGVVKSAAVRPIVLLTEEVVYGNCSWGQC